MNSLKNGVAEQYHPFGTDCIESIAFHEYGHKIIGYLNKSFPDDDICDIFAERVSNSLGLHVDKMKKVTSRYSWDNKYGEEDNGEFIAECFSEYYCSKNPSDISKAVVNETKSIIKYITESDAYMRSILEIGERKI